MVWGMGLLPIRESSLHCLGRTILCFPIPRNCARGRSIGWRNTSNNLARPGSQINHGFFINIV
jgi:hypothetical protein